MYIITGYNLKKCLHYFPKLNTYNMNIEFLAILANQSLKTTQKISFLILNAQMIKLFWAQDKEVFHKHLLIGWDSSKLDEIKTC